MKNIKRLRRSIMTLCKIFLAAAVVGTFLYAFLNWYTEVFFFFKGNFVLLFLYLFIYLLFMYTYKGFKIGALRLRELIFSHAFAVFLSDFIIYMVMCLISYQILQVWPILLCFGIQVTLASVLYYSMFRLNERLYPPENALLVRSSQPDDAALAAQFVRKCTRYEIRRTAVNRSFEEIVKYARTLDVIIVGMVDVQLRTRLMSYCFETGKQLFILPAMEDIMLNNAAEYMAEDLLVYRCRNRAFTPVQLAAKRGCDIALSILAMIITLPITLLAAVCIKLYDGGPVFFRQARLTKDKKEFLLLKFRSMIPDAEQMTGPVLATESDPRITPIGRFTRACRIDELPQLWNVLKGDMSLVGPRPERPELFEEICRSYPQFAYRLKVKAGITGYAQLYGKYNTDFADKVRLDLLYIEKASLLQDTQLLFYTLKILFMKESARGVKEEEQVKLHQEQ